MFHKKKSCRENEKSFYVQGILFPENLAFSEKMWRYIVESDRPHVTL